MNDYWWTLLAIAAAFVVRGVRSSSPAYALLGPRADSEPSMARFVTGGVQGIALLTYLLQCTGVVRPPQGSWADRSANLAWWHEALHSAGTRTGASDCTARQTRFACSAKHRLRGAVRRVRMSACALTMSDRLLVAGEMLGRPKPPVVAPEVLARLQSFSIPPEVRQQSAQLVYTPLRPWATCCR